MMEALDLNLPVALGVNMDVVQRMEKAKISRARENTRQKLEIINNRVKNIFEDYELGESMFAQHTKTSNVEFMSDIQELQSILGDTIKKNKYQQKVTIFIVGFQDVCTKRMQLLSQISEFFEVYARPEEVEDSIPDSLAGCDIDAIQFNIQTALNTMNAAVVRLGEINHDIMGYWTSSHSTTATKSNKCRKKLEKSLNQAKDDIMKMTDKLLISQQDLTAKEEQMQKLTRQLDNKSTELVNYKTQLEKSRKNTALAQEELNKAAFLHQDEVTDLKGQISHLEDEVQLMQQIREGSLSMSFATRIKEVTDASMTHLEEIRDRYNSHDEGIWDVKKDLLEQYLMQTQQIQNLQTEELESIQDEYKERASQIMQIQITDDDIQSWDRVEKGEDQTPRPNNEKKDSETSLKDMQSATPSPGKLSPESSRLFSASGLAVGSTLETVKETMDLTDDIHWEQLSDTELRGKFAEFRSEANRHLRTEMESNIDKGLVERDIEHEMKWREERATLLEHVRQLQKLQEEAEADADEAMRQLEDLATQQHESEQAGNLISGFRSGGSRVVRSVEPDEEAQGDCHDVEVKEQSTSPEIPKPLSSVSKKSVACLVEEKRAAMARRRESATRLVNSASGSKLATPGTKITDKSEAYENFAKCYKAVLDFRSRITALLVQNSWGHSPMSSLRQRPINVPLPDEHETDGMRQSVEETLRTVESVLKLTIASGSLPEMKGEPRSQDGGNYIENEILRAKALELENEIELMRSEFARRVQHDSAVIQHLQNTMSAMKQSNTTVDIPMTTNTPAVSAPVTSDHLLTLSQGHRSHTVDPSTTMLFTRLDSEHNVKTLMKSSQSGNFNQSLLDTLVAAMDGYNSIASVRLQHLAKKLVHHTKMKEIEMNVRNSNLVTSEVFDVLDKMEELQRRRAQNWSQEMDELNAKRKRLGILLQDSMQKLEKIAGVFLIKPILSYRGKTRPRKYSGKISTRFNQYQEEAMTQKERSLLKRNVLTNNFGKFNVNEALYNLQPSNGRVPWTAQENQEGLIVSGLARDERQNMWRLEESLPHNVSENKERSPRYSSLPASMPRLVELDVNRYLHKISNVHSTVMPDGPLKSPRFLTGPARSYAGISRTSGGSEVLKVLADSQTVQIRPGLVNTSKSDGSGDTDYQSTAPPTTPASQTQLHRGSSGAGSFSPSVVTLTDGSPNLPKPLPPIQVPSRSRASTRSSFSGSPIKEYLTPSSTRSAAVEEMTPLSRSKSETLLRGVKDSFAMGEGNSPAVLLPAETAN